MVIDIPTNSSRSFFHRGKISDSSFNVQVNSFLSNEIRLEALSLKIDNNFPVDINQIHFLYGSKLYQLQQEGNQLVFRGVFKNLSSLLSENSLLTQNYFSSTKPTSFFNLQEQNRELSLDHFFPILVQRALGHSSTDLLRPFHLPDNRGKLFVFSKIPDNLFLESPEITKKDGLVLYCLDVPLTGQAG